MGLIFSTKARPDTSKFHYTQLIYNGNWDPRPRAYKRFLSSLEIRTSVKTSPDKVDIAIDDPKLHDYPLLFISGTGGFAPFSNEQRTILRRFLKMGGTIVVDDSSGETDSEFDRSIRNEISSIIPELSLSIIPHDHVLYKSFYLLHSPSGRKIIEPSLEGITFKDEQRTALIYSRNDLLGAWSEDEFGKWEFECIPGGESQRELAFRLGINIMLYALTGNYKQDQIHVPFIKERQMNL